MSVTRAVTPGIVEWRLPWRLARVVVVVGGVVVVVVLVDVVGRSVVLVDEVVACVVVVVDLAVVVVDDAVIVVDVVVVIRGSNVNSLERALSAPFGRYAVAAKVYPIEVSSPRTTKLIVPSGAGAGRPASCGPIAPVEGARVDVIPGHARARMPSHARVEQRRLRQRRADPRQDDEPPPHTHPKRSHPVRLEQATCQSAQTLLALCACTRNASKPQSAETADES
jgi:hypothetical protein